MRHREIAELLAPILNHLLTTPPFDNGNGMDFGWFCREHAFVTKLAYHHFGIDCDIVRGHVAAYVFGEKCLSTTDCLTDHVWCQTAELIPCDLSMTFRHLRGYPQLNAPILGCEDNGAFVVIYAKDAANFPEALQPDVNAIYFAPSETLTHTSHEYISDPMLLLPTEESGRIALAIVAYILEVATSSQHLFHGDTPQDEALAIIVGRHPDAKEQLLRQIVEGN